MTQTEEALKLSLVYYGLLRDLSDLTGQEFDINLKAQAFEIVKEAVGQALMVTTQRCPNCDSNDIKVRCGNCDPKEIYNDGILRNDCGWDLLP